MVFPERVDSKSNGSMTPRRLTAVMVVFAACLQSPGMVTAQEITVEALIGDSVSLSNRDYPEIEDAIKRFQNQDVQGAQEYLKIAQQKYPKLPPIEVTLAKMFFFKRNMAAARQLLEKASVDYPDDPEAYLLVADRAFAEGRTMEADVLFDRASEIAAKFQGNTKRKKNFDIRVLAGKAAVHERRQQWDEALSLLRSWVKLDPTSVRARQRLGVTLFRTDRAAEAFEEFRKARQMDPKTSHPYVLMGNLFTRQGDIDKARTSFQQAYKEEQDNDQTARAYAEWLLRQNDLEQAQQVVAAMREQSPQSVSALLLDGVIARMQGRMKDAEEAFLKVLSLDPSNVSATNFLALVLAESDKVADQERALSYAQVNAQRFTNLSQPNITLAWVLYKLKRPTDGGKFLQRALKIGQLNADSAYLVARILSQQNQKEEARRALERVLQQAGAGMFIYRNDAEQLLQKLNAEIRQSNN